MLLRRVRSARFGVSAREQHYLPVGVFGFLCLCRIFTPKILFLKFIFGLKECGEENFFELKYKWYKKHFLKVGKRCGIGKMSCNWFI